MKKVKKVRSSTPERVEEADAVPDVPCRLHSLMHSVPVVICRPSRSIVSPLVPRFSDLDLGAVARSFCLLRLPKIAELSDPGVAESFEKERTVDFTAIK